MPETLKDVVDVLAILAVPAMALGWYLNLKRHKGSMGREDSWGAPSVISDEVVIGADTTVRNSQTGEFEQFRTEPGAFGNVADRHAAKALAVLNEQFVSDGVKTVRDPGLAVRLAEEELNVWFEDGDSPYSG